MDTAAVHFATEPDRTTPTRTPRKRLRPVFVAGTWGLGGAAVAAGGWIAGLILARQVFGESLLASDVLNSRPTEFAIKLAGIGGAWGLLAGLISGLARRGEDLRLLDRVASAVLRGVGLAVTGMLGGVLSLLLVQVVERAIPAEASSSLGWAFAGLLAGLVASGWEQLRVKSQPETAEHNADEFTDIGTQPTGERWPRTLLMAGAWALGGAAAAAGAWVIGLIAVHTFLGLGPLTLAFRTAPADSAEVMAGIAGASGLLIGAVAGLKRRRGKRLAAVATGAVGGSLVGLIGGGLAPLLVAVFGRSIPVEVSSSLGWAFAGLLAGLVAYGWDAVTKRREQRIREQERRLQMLAEED